MATSQFYDTLAPFYHLIYSDWEESGRRQAAALDSIIASAGGERGSTLLDAACGIGTQAIGLADLGYRVTASDIATNAVNRAATEAARRGLTMRTAVADLRRLSDVHKEEFEVVIACDNAIPHLLSDEEIAAALEELFRCTKPGGLCILSIRDYSGHRQKGFEFLPHGVREVDGKRFVLFQLWEWKSPHYETMLYVIEHGPGGEPKTSAARTSYYAVSIERVQELMRGTGFVNVQRLDEIFFQPVIIGRRTAV